jgi:Ca2+-binding EF-hand superfamily protein
MKSIGQNTTEKEIKTILEQVNVEGEKHQEIGFAQFVVILSRLTQCTSDEEQKEAFADIATGGYLDSDKFLSQLNSKDIGLRITKAELDKLINEADFDGDGKIDLQGLFYLYVKRQNFKQTYSYMRYVSSI